MTQVKIIDGDGHIFEDGEAIARHFPYSAAGGRLRSGVFPLNSHIQYSLTRTPLGAFATTPDGRFQNPGPEGWMKFMDQIGIENAVLFPTAGQRIGRIVDRDYAVARRGLTTTGSPKLIYAAIPVSEALRFCRCTMPTRPWKNCATPVPSSACAGFCFPRPACI
jgi:hypothetical protein